eukprot:1149402-Pelagomonas_calceolata.AAC.3
MRQVQAEESIQRSFGELVQQRACAQVGLVVGKYAVGSRDLMLGLIKTPAQCMHIQMRAWKHARAALANADLPIFISKANRVCLVSCMKHLCVRKCRASPQGYLGTNSKKHGTHLFASQCYQVRAQERPPSVVSCKGVSASGLPMPPQGRRPPYSLVYQPDGQEALLASSSGSSTGAAAPTNSSSNSKQGKKKGAGGGSGAGAAPQPAVSLALDTDWVVEHAAQVSRMLPGGKRCVAAAVRLDVIEWNKMDAHEVLNSETLC